MDVEKIKLWKRILNFIINVLTALITALAATSCFRG